MLSSDGHQENLTMSSSYHPPPGILPPLDLSGRYGPATDSEVATQRRPASPMAVHDEYHNKSLHYHANIRAGATPIFATFRIPDSHHSLVHLVLHHTPYRLSRTRIRQQPLSMAPTLTDREQELLVGVFKSFKSPPEVSIFAFLSVSFPFPRSHGMAPDYHFLYNILSILVRSY